MPLRLNLACGTDIRDGWVNLDVVNQWATATRSCDVHWDARTDKIPYADNSVDEIYAGYLFLHLPPRYHKAVVAEIVRVLSPAGVAVIGEVDMQIVMLRYLLNPYDTRLSELIWGEQGMVHGPNGDFLDARNEAFDKHCQGFTKELLTAFLRLAGFKHIDRIYVHSPEVFYELTLRCRK